MKRFICNDNVNFYNGELEQLNPTKFPSCVVNGIGTTLLCNMVGGNWDFGLVWTCETGDDADTV